MYGAGGVTKAGRRVIRNSLLVAIAAVLLSLLLHGAGVVVSFDPGTRTAESAPQDQADAAAFEDFVDAPLEPVAPQMIPRMLFPQTVGPRRQIRV